MIEFIAEHFWSMIMVIVIASFFVRKSTRKTACKILLIAVIVLAVLAGITAAGFYAFGAEFAIVSPWLFIIDGWLLFPFVYTLKDLIPVAALHRKGRRTCGTAIKVDHGRRSGYCIVQYTVGEAVYTCKTDRVKAKWQVGTENIPVLYDEAHPERACFAKHDLVSCIWFTVCFGGVLIVFAVSTVIVLIAACS